MKASTLIEYALAFMAAAVFDGASAQNSQCRAFDHRFSAGLSNNFEKDYGHLNITKEGLILRNIRGKKLPDGRWQGEGVRVSTTFYTVRIL